MQNRQFLFLFISLFSLSLSIPIEEAICQKALPFLSENSMLSYIGAGSGYLIFIDNEPVLAINGQADSLRLLSKTDSIAPMLYSYYNYQQDANLSSKYLLEAHASALSVRQASKGVEVAQCRQIIGTDTRRCDSFDSCQEACYSVTSYCYPIALGSGKTFIDAVWLYENDTRLLAQSLSDEESAYVLAAASPQNFALLSNYSETFMRLNKVANSLQNSVLVNWICPQQAFDMASMSKSAHSLSVAKAKLGTGQLLQYHAAAMARASAQNKPNLTALQISLSSSSSSTCPLRAEHFITSGNAASVATLKLEPVGKCSMGRFGVLEFIPQVFWENISGISWSIAPLKLDGRNSYWEFDSLAEGEVLTITAGRPGWLGYSRVSQFNNTHVYSLPAKTMLQGSAAKFIDCRARAASQSAAFEPTQAAGNATNKNNNYSAATASSTAASAPNTASAAAANAPTSKQPGTAASTSSSVQASSPGTISEVNQGYFNIIIIAVAALFALAICALCLFSRKPKQGTKQL